MKKKGIMSALGIIAIVSLLVVGGTLAWFTDTATVTNTFNAGSVEVKIDETWAGPISDWVPGDTEDKVVQVESLGQSKTFVRARLVPEWRSSDGVVLDYNNLILDLGDSGNWVYVHDDSAGPVSSNPFHGYFYYKEVLNKGEVTDILLNSVTIDGELTGNEYQSATLKLNVEVDAVQAENDAYKSVWGLNKLPFATPSELETGGDIQFERFVIAFDRYYVETKFADKNWSNVNSLSVEFFNEANEQIGIITHKADKFVDHGTDIFLSAPFDPTLNYATDGYWIEDNIQDEEPVKAIVRATFDNGESAICIAERTPTGELPWQLR